MPDAPSRQDTPDDLYVHILREQVENIEMERDQMEAWNKRLVAAANALSEAWDNWMEHEEGDGMDEVVTAVGQLRDVLRNG